MEDRLKYIGNWLRSNGEAIYGTKAYRITRQWSPGPQPKIEEKQYMGEYNIAQMVDHPAAGNARIDAFFTAKGDAVYALVPRWPESGLSLDGISARSGAKITMLETGDEVRWRAEGSRLHLDFPESTRAKIPYRDCYAIKMLGVN